MKVRGNRELYISHTTKPTVKPGNGNYYKWRDVRQVGQVGMKQQKFRTLLTNP